MRKPSPFKQTQAVENSNKRNQHWKSPNVFFFIYQSKFSLALDELNAYYNRMPPNCEEVVTPSVKSVQIVVRQVIAIHKFLRV